MRPTAKPSPSRARKLRLALALCFAIIAVWLARVGWHGYAMWARVNAIEAMAQDETQLAALARRARAELTGLRQDVAALHSDISWLLPILPYLDGVPAIGGDVAAIPTLLALAESTLTAADHLGNGWSPLLDTLSQREKGLSVTNLEVLLAQLPAKRAAFTQAQAHLTQATMQRQQLQEWRLSARTRSLLKRVDHVLSLLNLAAQVGMDAPELLGMNGARSYLIVAQNEDELRPTGGFISAVIRITFEQGKLTTLEFTDANQVDDLTTYYPDPPAPFMKYMLAEQWLFRDANWSPDFPTTARQLIAFYQQGRRKSADGVMAVDQTMVRAVVDALGPINVNGKVVTTDNLFNFMRNAWAPTDDQPIEDWISNRKQFIGQLATAMQNQLAAQKAPNLPALARVAYTALKERHLLIYLAQPSLADALAQLGWDGALRATAGDYLMVVDANLGFTKVNPFVKPAIDYTVRISPDGRAQSVLTLTYQHQGHVLGDSCRQRLPDYAHGITYAALMEGCYWDYVRVYVPQGSQLRDASRHPIPAGIMLDKKPTQGEVEIWQSEAGKNVFGNFFMLAWGRTQPIHFRYDLPRDVLRPFNDGVRQYTFYAQKQAGTTATPLTLSLTLPPQAKLIYADPKPDAMSAQGNATNIIYRLPLTTDVMVNLFFQQ